MTRVLCLVASVLVAPLLGTASQDPQAEIVTRARGAERIVVGVVNGVHSSFGTNAYGDQLIVSTLDVSVVETLKGARADSLDIEIEGGTVGDLTLRVSDMPEIEPGSRAVFFLDRAANGQFVPHGRGRGVMKLDRDDRVHDAELTLDAVKKLVATVKR